MNTTMPNAITYDCTPDEYHQYASSLAHHMTATTMMQWQHDTTGGGCDALCWNGDGIYILITAAGDASIPMNPEESVTVGFYDEDGEDQQLIEYPTLQHAINALTQDK